MINFSVVPPWIDYILVACMWAAAFSMAYVGIKRIGHPEGGIWLMWLRVIAASWGLYAARLTFVLADIGDLPLTWWTTIAMLGLAVGTTAMSIERRSTARKLRNLEEVSNDCD